MKNAVRIIALSMLLACGTAHAMEYAVFDFRGNVPAGTTPQHLTTVEVAKQGMYVQTTTDGLILLPLPGIAADSVTITLTNVATPRIALLWRSAGMGEAEYYQQNITLPTGNGQRAIVDLDAIPEWDPSAHTLALAFPAGSEVLIEQIEWHGYSAAEKVVNRFQSFWTPDTFKMYSINFLWGPLISTSPEARSVLYEELPPRAWSATWAFYALFALAAVAAIIARFTDSIGGPARMRTILLASGAVLWVLFDARMTQEIISYAANDWKTYVLAPAGERTLRTHVTLYDVLDEIDTLLGNDDRYVLITKEGTPFFSNVRYRLYPAQPVAPAEGTGVKAWVVLGMPGITVKDGALMAGDTVLSPAGTVVRQFDEGSFFYRAQ